jgi:hypothetical protein
MMDLRVIDIDFVSVLKRRYDVGIFASGYESRSGYASGIINPQLIKHPLVLGFTEEANVGNRPQNDELFLRRWKASPIPLSRDDEKPIYEYLNEYTDSIAGPLHVLVDYSSMSRLWYAAVLNWSRFAALGKEVVIDFVYSMGTYEEEDRPMVIRNMVSIPGCEGRAYRLRETVAVFGLGFHGLATLCVLDRLEASIVYAFLASPGVSREYVDKARKVNNELIRDRRTQGVLELPLASIEKCYRALAEVIAPHRPDGEITLVPMGPKPHVLASILLAMRFQEVACLRVSGTTDRKDVKPSSDIVATRVIIRGDSPRG